MKPNNLNTFRILFLIKGILSLVGSFFVLIYGVFLFFIFNEISKIDEGLPFNIGIIFLILCIVGFVILVTFGILDLIVSKRIKEVRSHQFIFVVAIISCLTGLLGILLGIFTLIELSKPEVKALFEENKA